MKKTVLIAMLSSLFIISANAQKVKEVGLKFSNLDNFGLIYKTGTEKGLLRLSLLSVSTYHSDQNTDQNVFGGGIGGGYEWRKSLSKDFSFVYGPELKITGSRTKIDAGSSSNYTQTYIQPNLGLILGFRYLISDKFAVSAELSPSLFYQYQLTDSKITGTEKSDHAYGFSMSNNSAAITIAYRWK